MPNAHGSQIFPIGRGGPPPNLLPIHDHNEESKCACEGYHSRRDKAVLQALRRPPRCDGIAETKPNGVTNQHNRYRRFACNLFETIDVVADSNRSTSYTSNREHSEPEYEPYPVDVIVSADPPYDETSGGDNAGNK